MRIKLVALVFLMGLGHFHACTGDSEQTEAVQEDAAVGNASDEITPESQEVADAELTTPGESESSPAETSDSEGATNSAYAESDESMAMYSEPPLPGDESELDAKASATNGVIKADETAVVDNQVEQQKAATVDTESARVTAEVPEVASAVPVTSKVGSDSAPDWTTRSKVSNPATQAAVNIEKTGTYTVRPGDTLGKIAIILYHNFNRFRDLAEENGLTHPYLLYPGQTLRYGGSVAVTDGSPIDKSLIVQTGDTLWHLAQKHLGSPYAWPSFVNWNPGVLTDPNRIAPGMKLVYGSVAQSGGTVSSHTSGTVKPSQVSGSQQHLEQSQAGKTPVGVTTKNDQKSAKLTVPSPTTKTTASPIKPSSKPELDEAKKSAFEQLAEPPEVPENAFEEEEAE